jgi:hypothetical protein
VNATTSPNAADTVLAFIGLASPLIALWVP